MTLEIGRKYHIYNGKMDFTGILLEIYDDDTCFVQSAGTGSRYRVSQTSLFPL